VLKNKKYKNRNDDFSQVVVPEKTGVTAPKKAQNQNIKGTLASRKPRFFFFSHETNLRFFSSGFAE
jgi:hypothetical protein